MTEQSFEKLMAERDEALRNLDIEWARKQTASLSNEVLLIGLHKARYECKSLEPEYRHTSGEFLRTNGYKRMFGLPLLPEGELP